MKAYLSRRYRLSASHRLHSAEFTPEQNLELYGKCNNPHGHGHNYVVQVTVSGPVDEVTGTVCDLTSLDLRVQAGVIDRFDHTNLNTQECFIDLVPTTENLCKTIYRLLGEGSSPARPGSVSLHDLRLEIAGLESVKLERVRVEETANNFFEYSGKDEHGASSS